VKIICLKLGLIGVEERAEAVLDAEHIVADGVQVRALDQSADGDGGGHDDAVRVQTGEVQGARGLELGGVQAVTDDAHIGQTGVLSVGQVAIRRIEVLGQVNIGGQVAELTDIHTVHLGLELVILDESRVGASASVSLGVVVAREGQELDGLSQSQLLHRLGAQNDRALDLGNQQILGRVGEVIALSLVQVREVGPADVLQLVVSAGAHGGVEAGRGRQA